MRGHFVRRSYIDKRTGQKRTASTWSVYYDEPSADGKRHKRAESGFRTRKEAEAWFARKAEQLRHGIAPSDARATLEHYLTEWLTALEAPGSRVRAAALHAYRNHITRHIIPAIGKVKVADLNVAHIEHAKAAWAATLVIGKKRRTLSQRTVRHIYGTLNSALNRAKKQRMISLNPCELTEAPHVERKEMTSLDVPAAAAVLHACQGTPIEAAIITALGTGLRRGELLGLRWSDVDLEDAKLTVNRSLEHVDKSTRFKDPKTKRSRRTIELPTFVVERLRRHRIEQAERFLSDGLGRPKSDTLLFERAGEPWVPNSFGTMFWQILKNAGLPHIRLHDLRHSFASMALSAGVDLKTVSTALGHSTISTTADLYAHVTTSLMRDAAQRIDAVVGGALRRSR